MEPVSPARQWSLDLVGAVVGTLTAFLDLCAGVGIGTAYVLNRVPGRDGGLLRSRAVGTALAVTDIELRRIAHFHGPVPTDPLAPRRCGWYLMVRPLVGILGGGVVLLLLLCLVVAGSMASAWVLGGTWGLIKNETGYVDTGLIALATPPGALLIFVTIVGISGVGSLDRWVVQRVLGRDTDRFLRARVAELTSTRDDVVDAVDEERRRIERDLHDGVQQRLVTLGMLIGRAQRSGRPEHLGELLAQAHDVSRDALSDLREVANRVYPVALDKDGPEVALELLAERAGIPVRLDFRLCERLRQAIEATIYFVVAEAVTNATKHARATLVDIIVTKESHGWVVVTVTDDGRGGADPSGSGLSGLARRAAAVDGTLTVQSPYGGPTALMLSVPCE